MKIVWSWLREFVPVEASPEDVADRLSMQALKVERVERLGAEIEGVIVGSVVKVGEVPGADKVVLVTVDTGSDVREIVCGARNYGPGDKVPVAMPGARLPGGFEIGERTFKGVTSHGMLCSARELGISEDHSGILVLETEAPLGTDVRTVLGLDEVVLDVEVTANRPDALSVVGVAREVAALYGLPLTVPAPSVKENGDAAASLASVTVEDAAGCPRYLARVVTGLRNGSSPEWMQRRLTAAGMRPISAIVDVTNYVLLERGHPTHAFDLSLLDGASIVVRNARPGETMRTLDDVERTFEPDDVLICDASRPVAVAGIMGGADTEVSEATTTVLLESAYFDPARVRRTARRLGLRTEASVRFERGADPNAAYAAADRVAELLQQICGGSVAAGVLDVSASIPPRAPVRLRPARAATLIGVPVTADEITSLLRSVGMEVNVAGSDLSVVPPAFRPDVEIEEDLVEEVARLYGYDRIPETLPAAGRVGGLSRAQSLRRLVRASLLGAGLSEAQTLSLLAPSFADRLGLPAGHPWRSLIALANPLSEEESVLRPSLLPGLLFAAERNVARRVPTVALFEIGVAFEDAWQEDPRGGRIATEHLRAAFVLAGTTPSGWHGERSYDFFDAKGVVERIASAIGAPAPSFAPPPVSLAELHPGRSASVSIGGATIGAVGEVHPRVARTLDLTGGRVAVAELDLAPLFAAVRESSAPDLRRFPSADRDLAVVVPVAASAGDVEATIREAAGSSLESVTLFDVYRGEQAGEGNVSLAYRLVFRHPERTLTDAEVGEPMNAILAALDMRGWRPRA